MRGVARRVVVAVAFPASLSLVASPVLADGLPVGLGYEYARDHVEVTDNSDQYDHKSFDFTQATHTFSLLDYSGFLCAGFQNAHRDMEARNAALDAASHDSSVKAGDKINYSYQPASVTPGAPCGVRIHRSSGGTASVHGQDVDAKLSGWSVFGGFTAPFEDMPTTYWKAFLYGDFRSLEVDGKDEGSLIQMPFEFELGHVITIKPAGDFIVAGMLGWDPVFALLKAIDPSQMPASLWRYGVTVGYQLPVESMQVRLSYRSTDEGFDEIGYKEHPISLGLFYQM